MKRLFSLVSVISAVGALCASALPASAAGDRGPQVQTTAVTTNANPAAVVLPLGDTGSFTPLWAVVSGNLNGTTQTLTYVAGAYTGTVASVTSTGLISLTNVPTQFSGDKYLLTTTGLTTNIVNVAIIGRVFN
jgi:hypothetical protein